MRLGNLVWNLARFAIIVAMSVSLGWAQEEAQQEEGEAPPSATQAKTPEKDGQSEIEGGLIRIDLGKSHVIKDVGKCDINDPKVVEAKAVGNGDLIMKGKTPGRTRVVVMKTGGMGTVSYDVEVAEEHARGDINVAFQQVKEALSGINGVQVRKQGNVIELHGDVQKWEDGIRIDRQLERQPDEILDLTKRVYLEDALGRLNRELAASPYKGIKAETQMDETHRTQVILRGSVPSETQLASVLEFVDRFLPRGQALSQIRILPPLVEIDMEVYTIDLEKARAIGNNTLLQQISIINSTGWAMQTGPGSSTEYPLLTGGAFANEFIRALSESTSIVNKSMQHASVRSGEEASVENAVDLWVKISSESSSELKKITTGQRLKIVPTVQENGNFETAVEAELSRITDMTEEGDVEVGRRSVASKYISTVDETVVLGGTTHMVTGTDKEATPFLGRVPIIGWLFFRSKEDRYDETAQVFLMTLRMPSQFAAKDKSQSSSATRVKEESGNKSDETKKDLFEPTGVRSWE